MGWFLFDNGLRHERVKARWHMSTVGTQISRLVLSEGKLLCLRYSYWLPAKSFHSK